MIAPGRFVGEYSGVPIFERPGGRNIRGLAELEDLFSKWQADGLLVVVVLSPRGRRNLLEDFSRALDSVQPQEDPVVQ